ncbi:15746_t:CDS:1, partial [Rhizophagus irregularis]
PDDIYDGFKLTPKKNIDDFIDVERLSPFLNNVEQWVLKIDLSMQL